MKNIFFRLLVAAALTLAALALSSSAHGQQADEDATPTTAGRQAKTPQSPVRAQIQSPDSTAHPSAADQTQDELVFTGRIAEENRALVLKDLVTKLTYQLDDQPRARKFMGRQVKIRGKLEMNSNTIQISRIEPVS
jgi:hypothetical protein